MEFQRIGAQGPDHDHFIRATRTKGLGPDTGSRRIGGVAALVNKACRGLPGGAQPSRRVVNLVRDRGMR